VFTREARVLAAQVTLAVLALSGSKTPEDPMRGEVAI
jgi:hypothetical protein